MAALHSWGFRGGARALSTPPPPTPSLSQKKQVKQEKQAKQNRPRSPPPSLPPSSLHLSSRSGPATATDLSFGNALTTKKKSCGYQLNGWYYTA